MPEFKIGSRQIGESHPTYVIAEMSGNHNQNFDEACEIVRAAAEAGADALKLQTYTADTITLNVRNEHFMIGEGTLWEGKNLHDLYGEAFTPWEWQPKLKELGESLGMQVFSSPFDPTSVDFLEEMGVEAYKIASFELVDIPLIRYVAGKGKPIIMSTGMARLEEIQEAVEAAREGGCKELALLKCNSAYPAPPSEMNLNTIPDLAKRFEVVAGLSDHTLGSAAAIASVALGARIIEKHFTLSRAVPGPDSAFSMEPAEFKVMVDGIREAEQSLGMVRYEITEKEKGSRVFRKSIFVSRDVKRGERFSTENLRCVRPGNGLHTRHFDELLGRVATQDIVAGTPMSLEFAEEIPS